MLAADAIRCGVLMDLAFLGRLAQTADSVEIDDRPTGFSPADQLLLAMAAEPDRPLDSWFSERQFSPQLVMNALVEVQRWRRRKRLLRRDRYVLADSAQREADIHMDVATPAPTWKAADAAVGTLGTVAHLIGRLRTLGLVVAPPAIPGEVLEAAGEAQWVLEAAMDYLQGARAQYRMTDAVLGSGGAMR